MHNQDIIDLVIFLMDYGPQLWERQNFEVPKTAVDSFWLAARAQIDNWTRQLKALETPPRNDLDYPFRYQRGGLAEEIITQELLTRIWTAVLHLYEQKTGNDYPASLVHNVYLSHLELRGRILGALNRPDYLPRADAQRLLQLCERTDRWNDLLLGILGSFGDVQSLAVDAYRLDEFAEDYRHIKTEARRRQTWKLMKASLRAAYNKRIFPYQPHSDWTLALFGHILGFFPPDIAEQSAHTHLLQAAQLIARCRKTEELLFAVVPEECG
ncbi:hypothetical protein [Thermogutta sp.]|uniref:hypothetical protein n=1 Tax=Thermogutta sp. TaxID=1962930 RepID=UPI00321F74A7